LSDTIRNQPKTEDSMQGRHPEDPSEQPSNEEPEKQFHPWRLLGIIGVVLLLLVAASALVDVMVLGW